PTVSPTLSPTASPYQIPTQSPTTTPTTSPTASPMEFSCVAWDFTVDDGGFTPSDCSSTSARIWVYGVRSGDVVATWATDGDSGSPTYTFTSTYLTSPAFTYSSTLHTTLAVEF